MNRKYLYISLLFLILIIISSCKDQIYYNELNKIRKGNNQKQVKDLVDMKPNKSYTFNFERKKIDMDIYKLVVDQFTTTSQVYSTVSKSYSTVSVTHYVQEDFIILFEDNKMKNCFKIYDVNKEEDLFTQAVADSVIKYYNQYKD